MPHHSRLRDLARQATTLTEALALWRWMPGASVPDDAHATETERAWRQALGVADEATFARWLSWHGITVADLPAVVGHHTEHQPLAEWTEWFAGATACAAAAASECLDTIRAQLPDNWPADDLPFPELAWPWLELARQVVAERLPTPPVTIPWAGLERQLLRELGRVAGRAWFEAFSRDGAAPPDDGPTGSAVYAQRIGNLLGAGWWPFFATYPVLARQLATVTQGWTAAAHDLITRLAADADSIQRDLGDGRPLGHVVRLDPGLSDPHDGRRRVVIVHFSTGFAVVYKPRRLDIEACWAELLNWAAARGAVNTPRAARVVTRSTYGWMEYLGAAGQADAVDADTYVRQAGALTAWAHVLRGRDLHHDNVIATPHGPAIIDAEVLLQPVGRDEQPLWPLEHEAVPAPGSVSALLTGLISLIEDDPDTDTVQDVGALNASGRVTRTAGWDASGTAAVRRVVRQATPGPSRSVLLAADGPLRPRAHRRAFLDAFRETYRFVVAHRDELLGHDGPVSRMASVPIRVVWRRTEQYAQLLQALSAPGYLVNGTTWSAWVDILGREDARAPTRPPHWPIFEEERLRLADLDVPRFWMLAGGTALMEGDAVVMSSYTTHSGLDAVRRQIHGMNDADLAAQLRLVAMAVDGDVEGRFARIIDAPEPETTPDAVTLAFVAAAETVAEELLEHRGAGLHSDNTAEPDAAWHLYQGHAGLPVLLAALARVTGSPRWREQAELAAAPLLTRVSDACASHGALLGGTSGPGSLIYALGVIGRLLHRSDIVERCVTAAVASATCGATSSSPADVTSGAAGAVLVCLSLLGTRRDEDVLRAAGMLGLTLEVTERSASWGSWWPSGGTVPYAGFAHGAAGVGTAACCLGAKTGDDRWFALARRAWASVQGAWIEAERNWPVGLGPGTARPSMAAWCHGSPGILIGLARTLDFGHEHAILTQATDASLTLSRLRAHREDHVCCGNPGRNEALLVWGSASRQPALVEVAQQLAADVLRRAARRGHIRLAVSGHAYPVHDAGFFRGVSGVAYQWLRHVAPMDVPSVLGIE